MGLLKSRNNFIAMRSRRKSSDVTRSRKLERWVTRFLCFCGDIDKSGCAKTWTSSWTERFAVWWQTAEMSKITFPPKLQDVFLFLLLWKYCERGKSRTEANKSSRLLQLWHLMAKINFSRTASRWWSFEFLVKLFHHFRNASWSGSFWTQLWRSWWIIPKLKYFCTTFFDDL